MKTKFQKDRAFHKIVQCIKSCITVPHLCVCFNMIYFFEQQFEKDSNTYKDIQVLRNLLSEQSNYIKLCSIPVN